LGAEAQIEIVEVEETTELARSVIELGNGPAKRTLGFLPNQGFLDRARRGTLLAAVANSELLGYVLYDLPGYVVKIVHLCVANKARRRGVARKLIDEVAERHSDRQRIVLSCRYDYEATAVWEALEFRPQGSRPGRSKDGHMLTIWVRDFDHPTLFDEFEDERQAVALDHNVFLDLHMDAEKRPEGAESRYLLDDWIGEYVELCVTDEVFHEIHDHADAIQRAAEQHWASSYRNLSKSQGQWSELASKVATLVPKAGAADHRHVARAAAGGARYLVSRDRELLRGSDAIEAALGIRILPPEGLIVRLDQQRADSAYRPSALLGTELRQLSPPDDLHDVLFTSLLNNSEGERRSDLGARLRPMLADPTHHDVQVVQTTDNKVVAGFARRVSDRELEVPFLRVAPATPGANVVARQLLFAQRKRAADLDLDCVRITDPHLTGDVREALKLEHFDPVESGWICRVKIGVLNATEAGNAGTLARASAIEFEDKYWPAKITGAEIDTYVVPIKVAFAESLLNPGLAEQSLLPRQLGLGLSREHVYYRHTLNSRGIGPGARILWYVTGGTPVHARGSIRAVSQVADVVVGRPRSLHARFERFGVYSLEQVSSLADRNGQVMALRFVNTEVLERPMTLDDLEALWVEIGERFLAPQSPTIIGEHMFYLIYQRSSSYAS
jgi:ribosomal protein S18 acetylase RimI-like enzyme